MVLCAGAGACVRLQPKPPSPQVLVPGHVALAPELAMSADANFVLTVSEAVGTPEEDTASYTQIVIDGRPAGRVPIGPRSQQRKWGARLEIGNHLFRFEQWRLPPAGDWGPLDAQWQPNERFIRVERGARTSVVLKFYEGGRKHEEQIAREPLPAGAR